jgi:hypothetical protein
MTDYQEALQSPSLAFSSSELRSGAAVENNLGLPRPICGTFASVYELVNGRHRWAVKCFLRNTPDLHERYAKISNHLRKCQRLGYFVTFEYQQKAIRVRGELVANLRSADIAHGDLQHGNILVQSNGAIRLIDYDGMWVPALKGHKSNETGHPDFQNPHRTRNDFNLGIDEFSAAVIRIAILALRRDRSLWEKYNNGDNLLFRRRDFVDPRGSPLMADLRALDDDDISEKLDFITKACTRSKRGGKRGSRKGKATGNRQGVEQARPRTEEHRRTDTRAPRPTSWLNDHVEDYGGAPRPPAPPPYNPSSAGVLEKVIGWLFRP